MSTNSLERAIKLVEQGKISKAQKVLKSILATDHHNVDAWLWYVETCPTNRERCKVLELCLEYNPDKEQVKQALDKLRTLPAQQSSARHSILGKIKFAQKNFHWSNLVLYLPLIGLSAISALLIASISLIAFQGGDGDLGAFLILMLLQIMQWILVLPATAVVYFIYSSVSYKASSNDIHPLIRIGIPLTFNILGAGLIYILLFALRAGSDLSGYFVSRNVTLTIQDESIVIWNGPNPPWSKPDPEFPYAYQVILNVENRTSEEIQQIQFYLGAYAEKDLKWPDSIPRTIGSAQLTGNPVPRGSTYIHVEIPIQKSDLQCNSPNLVKPLSLFYSVVYDHYRSVEVSNSINQQLLQIACGSIP